MKKLLTVLLTVLIAFTTLTINVAAATYEAPEEEVKEILGKEESNPIPEPPDPPKPKEKVTVTFNPNGGTFDEKVKSIVEVDKGTDVDLIKEKDIKREGYKLVGWTIEEDKDNPEKVLKGEKYKANESTTLFACWEEKAGVTFDANFGKYGKEEKDHVFVEAKKGIVQLDEGKKGLKRDGYEFVCWTTERDNLDKKVEGTEIKTDKNITLYAYWSKLTRTINVYVHNNTEYEATGSYIPIKGATIEFKPEKGEEGKVETNENGFASITVPSETKVSWTVNAKGFKEVKIENKTYEKDPDEENFWLDELPPAPPVTNTITLDVVGSGKGDFVDVWTGEKCTSISVEEGKYISNNTNGYFYIADDKTGTNVHPYQFVAENGSRFVEFKPTYSEYTEITKNITLTAEAKKVVKVTFHAGTPEQIKDGAAITDVTGKWNWDNTTAAYCDFDEETKDEYMIKDFTTNVTVSYEGHELVGWEKDARANGVDFYPNWKEVVAISAPTQKEPIPTYKRNTYQSPEFDGYDKEVMTMISPWDDWGVTTRAINAGTYTVKFKLNDPKAKWADGTNTDGRNNAIVEWKINPKAVEIPTKQSFEYNGNNQHPVLPEGLVFASRGENSAKDAGEYAAMLTLVNDNYAWPEGYEPKEYIESHMFWTETVEYCELPWSITKKDATITVGDLSKTYGDPNPDFRKVNIEGEGFVRLDWRSDEFTRYIRPTLKVNVVDLSDNAGEYDITVTYNEYAARNYNIEVVNGTFTINKAELIAKLADTELTYNGVDQKPEVLFEGFTGYEDEHGSFVPIKNIDYTVWYNYYGDSINAGEKHAYVKLASQKLVRNYVLTDGSDDPEYTRRGNLDLTYTIAPKVIRTRWDNLEYVYDGEFHSPDLTFIDKTYLRDGIGYIQVDLPAHELPEDHDFNEEELMAKFELAQKSNDALFKFRDADTYYTFGLIAGRTSNYTFVGEHEDDIDPWIGLITFTEFHIHQRDLKVLWGDKVKFKYDGKEHAPEILGAVAVNDLNGDTTGIVARDEGVVELKLDITNGKKIKPASNYIAEAVLASKGTNHRANNYRIVENKTINFKIYRKPNDTPVKTGVDR